MLKELAEKYGIKEGTVRSRKCREKWEKKVRVKTSKKATEKKPTKQRGKKKKNIATLQGKEKLPHGEGICGARAKQTGQPCKQKAGWGTDHVGTGRCKLHGGCSPGAPKGNKYTRTHGVYET